VHLRWTSRHRIGQVAEHAARLKYYADSHGPCVLCVNQV
jgi:hypothetical protein